MRILVAGSRAWDDAASVAAVLDEYWPARGTTLTVVHGDCPRGADRHARTWCAQMADLSDRACGQIVEERHPADWNTHGKAAGFRRNADMVAAGADLCVAFIRDNSAGASHTVRLATEAGIPTRVIRWEDRTTTKATTP